MMKMILKWKHLNDDFFKEILKDINKVMNFYQKLNVLKKKKKKKRNVIKKEGNIKVKKRKYKKRK